MQITNWVLKIFIHVSAFVCSIKRRNMILHMVLEFFYLVVILALPVFVITFFICSIVGNEAVDLVDVGKYIGIGVFGCCYYYVFSNRKSDNNIEKHILKISIAFVEYYHDETRVKAQRRHIILEYINFLVLCIFLICILGSLSNVMGFNTVNAALMCMILGFLLAYVLYVHVNQDERTKEERKTYIGIAVTVVWLIVIIARLNKYISDSIMMNSEDTALLVFSMIFTFPTIFAWIKNIPRKINAPYKDKVEKRSQELIDTYSWDKLRTKAVKQIVGFFLLCKALKLKLSEDWKSGNKKKVILFWVNLIIAVIAIIIANWLSRYLPLAMDNINRIMMDFYNQLSINAKEVLRKILVGLFLSGIMVLFLVKLPTVLKKDKNVIGKLKSIVFVVILEGAIGYTLYLMIMH